MLKINLFVEVIKKGQGRIVLASYRENLIGPLVLIAKTLESP